MPTSRSYVKTKLGVESFIESVEVEVWQTGSVYNASLYTMINILESSMCDSSLTTLDYIAD